MALGEVDYGLMGVVGGITMFIGFFNGILSGAISRFYAFSVGKAQKEGNEVEGLEECRRWFSVAVSVHSVIPVVLMVVGYPTGVYAIEHWLTIPTNRIGDCVWVFRFVCMTSFIGMITVPFNAMYGAKQLIAELTIYSFVTSTLNVVFLYYMISHPGVWLAKYAFWTCALSIIPSLIISGRALCCFPECRIRRKHLWNLSDIRELLSFAGWNLFGATGNLLKGAGMTVLVNKFFGPVQNASVAIANTVAGHSQSLAGSMVGAFMPAITTACGAGDRSRMVALIHQTCKFGALLVLPFALPLALEIDEVMVLWLKNPPAQSGVLCIWMMAILVLENLTTGLWTAISANGKIAWYQFTVGTLFILTLPLAWLLMRCGFGLYSVGYALFTTLSIVVFVRIVAARILLGISPCYWTLHILVPIIIVCVITCAVGCLPRIFMEESFWRICVTVFLVEIILVLLAWNVLLDYAERAYLKSKFVSIWMKHKGSLDA